MQKLRTRLLAKKDAMKKNKKGFTLVEIIVVLAIIAILAAVTIPSIIGFVNQAKEKVLISDARTAYIACQMEVSEKYAANVAVAGTDLSAADYAKKILKTDIDAYLPDTKPVKIGFTAEKGSITEFAYQKAAGDKVVLIHGNKGSEVVKDWPTSGIDVILGA